MPWNVWNIEAAGWASPKSFKARAEAIDYRDNVILRLPQDYGSGPFEVRRTGEVLEEHGTKLMQLKPSMIWSCAMADLERLAHNKAVVASKKEPPHFRQQGEFKQYAFHRRHVLKAGTANDIIRAAIEQPGIGQASGKKDTRLLYSDVDLLRASLK